MLTLRPATPGDAATLAALIGQSFRAQAEALAISRIAYPNYVAFESEAGVRRRMASGTQMMLGYACDELVGTVSWYQRGELRGDITRLAVHPEHRGNGYGRELMACAERQLAAAGTIVAELTIVARFTRLRRYYEELGYTAGELKPLPQWPFELLFMDKMLSP